MKKRIVLAVVAVAIFLLGGTTTAVLADRINSKPPRAASEQARKALINPPADPDDISGPVDVSVAVAALIERDPATGDVIRDERGRPKFFTNPDGTPRMFTMDDVPPGQVEAYGKWHERMNAAQAGDRAAQAHLENEQRKTDAATGRPPR